MPKRKEPSTPEEWREAVLLAHAARLIEDCRLYGLIEGGPKINVARCDDLIERGADRGIVPTFEEVKAAAIGIALQGRENSFGGV